MSLKVQYKGKIVNVDEKGNATGDPEGIRYLQQIAGKWSPSDGDRHMAMAAYIQKQRNPQIVVINAKPMPPIRGNVLE